MKRILHHNPQRQSFSDGPLADAGDESASQGFTPGGAYIHRRTGLPAGLSNVLAELNGLGPRAR
jgi:hypothetical protein